MRTPTPVGRRWTLAVLTATYGLSVLDRYVFGLVLQPIKAELGLSNTQLGVLSGLAFALFYATLGLPIAKLADRTVRRNIVAASLALFSAMTAVCGLAGNFWQMLLARIGVGVGEAGTNPPSVSMIADLYDDRSRAVAMAIFSVGASLAIAIGFIVAGYVAEHYGWRYVFFIAGGPGVLVAAIMFLTVREPDREQAPVGDTSGQTKNSGMFDDIAIIWSQHAYRYLALGSALTLFITNGFLAWLPSFFMLTHGMGESEIGSMFGPILGLCSAAGILTAGLLADRVGANDMRWKIWIVAVAMLLGLPLYAVMLLAGSKAVALAAFVVPAFLLAFFQPPLLAVTQALTPVRMRSMSAALMFFIGNIIGLGLGPICVGWMTDLMTPALGDAALGRALLVAVGVIPLACLMLHLGAQSLIRDLQRVDTL